MALVLKTSDTERYRGFESLSLRHFHNLWAMQKYPSGRRGSPAKGVGCGKRRVGSNPTFCARRKSLSFKDFFFFRFCKRKNSFISDKFPFMFERVVFKNERQKLTQKLTRTDKERPPGKGGLLSFTDVRQIRPGLLQRVRLRCWYESTVCRPAGTRTRPSSSQPRRSPRRCRSRPRPSGKPSEQFESWQLYKLTQPVIF